MNRMSDNPKAPNSDAARAEERWFRGIDDAPTPPSDAGTSERETRDHRTATGETCPKCGNAKLVFRLQGSQPRFDNLRSCRCCGEMFALPAAAPAAEGPRAEASGINCSECETDDDVPCLCNAAAAEGPQDCPHGYAGGLLCGFCDDPYLPEAERPRNRAAALPGAEAGTPSLERAVRELFAFIAGTDSTGSPVHQLPDPLDVVKEIRDHVVDLEAQLEDTVRRLAALTSEVAQLTALAKYADHTAECKIEGDEVPCTCGFDAARLASPSPTAD